MNHVEAAERARRRASALAASIDDAACGGLGEWWSTQEARLRDTYSLTQAEAAAAAALDLCRHCPEVAACAELARVGRYSGLAAGDIYVAGRPRRRSTARSPQTAA